MLRRACVAIPALLIAVAAWSHRWMNEDAYIYLRVVDQVFAGNGPVFNAGERIEATTGPLWLGVLVLGRFLFGWFLRDEWIAVLAALFASVAAFAVAGRATLLAHRDEAGIVVPVGLLLVAAVTVVWDFSTSGLEMGLTWLWLAVSWLGLVWAARHDELRGWRRNGACVVLGVAPLVRPELGVMMICLLVGWFVLARPRRILVDLVWMFSLPLAYEIFRMGYYASLVPNTALAKGAGGLHPRQGWNYLFDFVSTYQLWVTAVLVLVVIALRWVRVRDRRLAVATMAMIGAAALDAAYIVAIGGDYMHGRLLLPAFFAFGLPASICVQRRRLPELVLAGAVAVWVLVSVAALRPTKPAPTGYLVVEVADWRAVSGAKIVLDDAPPGAGLSGHDAAALYANGQRGYYRVLTTDALPSLDPDAFVFTLGSIGVPAYNAGREVFVVDIGGLAEPLAARTDIVPGRPAGHRKQVDPAWYDARFGVPSADDSAAVLAARHALGCGQVKDLVDAVDGDMSPGRFVSNMWDSFSLTRMNVPADPIEAEQRFCP